MIFINNALTEISETSLIAFKFAQVSICTTVVTTSWHENVGAVLATLVERRAFTSSLSENSSALHGAFIIIGESINSTNRSIFLFTTARG